VINAHYVASPKDIVAMRDKVLNKIWSAKEGPPKNEYEMLPATRASISTFAKQLEGLDNYEIVGQLGR
jgi:hypothetical protein